MARELAKLKEESEIATQKIMCESPLQAISPSARNSRIAALENMLATSSNTLVFMASELSEAEERERVFSGRGRWNQVRSLIDAKNLMNRLFDLAASYRCQLWDKEVGCREKDAKISELKEKIYRLSSLARQLDSKQKSQLNDGTKANPRKPVAMDLRDAREGVESEADMDTSSDSDENGESDEDWVESRKAKTKRRSRSKMFSDDYSAAVDQQKVCCSCSKKSSCKTVKCECRAAGKSCGICCGCISLKCSNREVEEEEERRLDSDMEMDDEKLISQGTLLLQSALSDKQQLRRPLSDIGNKQGKANREKQAKKKQWRKLIIQLVPSDIEGEGTGAAEAPRSPQQQLRRPQAAEAISLEIHHPPFGDSNAVRNDESSALRGKENTSNRAGAVPPPAALANSSSRFKSTAPSDDKENKML